MICRLVVVIGFIIVGFVVPLVVLVMLVGLIGLVYLVVAVIGLIRWLVVGLVTILVVIAVIDVVILVALVIAIVGIVSLVVILFGLGGLFRWTFCTTRLGCVTRLIDPNINAGRNLWAIIVTTQNRDDMLTFLEFIGEFRRKHHLNGEVTILIKNRAGSNQRSRGIATLVCEIIAGALILRPISLIAVQLHCQEGVL